MLIAPVTTTATNITNTTINKTQINQNATNESDSVDQSYNFDRAPVDEATLRIQVEQETVKLNALLQSTLKTMVANSKDGKFQTTVIAEDKDTSVPLVEVVGVDSEWEAEKRQREIEERLKFERFKRGEVTEEELRAQILRSVFPVKTPLKATKLPSRVIKLNSSVVRAIQEPIAVIGSDEYSLAWFKSNLEVIRKVRAGVIVTEVKSPVDFDAIRALAPDLMFQPIDASDFLRNLGVGVYPILITNEGALQ